MTSWEKQGYQTTARTLSRIEHIFGAMTQRAGNLILRSIGISRAEVKLGLRNLAYNMEKFCFLMRQTAYKEVFPKKKQMKCRLFLSRRLEKEEAKS